MLELHPRALGDLLARADADEHVLRARVLFLGVVDVVGGGNGNTRLAGDLHDLPVDQRLLRDPVVLHLEVKTFRAEQLAVVLSARAGFGVLAVEDGRGDVTRQAGAQRNQAFVVPPQQLVVDSGLVIEAFRVRQRAQRNEILVSREVAGKEHQVMVPHALLGAGLFQPGARRRVHLGPDDRADALCPAFLVEGQGAEHVAVVGEREGGHSLALCLRDKGVDGRSAIKEGEIRMAMQMSKRRHVSTPLPDEEDNRGAALCKYGCGRATLER